MPTYQYVCTECGGQLEAVQRFTDDPLTVHEDCGGRLRKVFSPVGIVFKGSGFYKTDSRSSASAASAGTSKDGEPKGGDSKSGESKSGESKGSESKGSDSKGGDSKSGDSKPKSGGDTAPAKSSSGSAASSSAGSSGSSGSSGEKVA